MGLGIAANLAKALGGSVWCVSHGNTVAIGPGGEGSVPGLYFPGTAVCMRLPITSDSRVRLCTVLPQEKGDGLLRYAPGDGLWSDEDDNGENLLW